MRLLDLIPENWQDLQRYVAQLLNGCQYSVEIEKRLFSARGEAVVDIYAIKDGPLRSTIFCEYKLWKSNVPQQIIHGFRTIVHDSGATDGLIIAKRGFQSGAYEAVKYSNVRLLTLEGFNENSAREWINCMIERNKKIGKELQNFGIYLLLNMPTAKPKLYEYVKNSFWEYREDPLNN